MSVDQLRLHLQHIPAAPSPLQVITILGQCSLHNDKESCRVLVEAGLFDLIIRVLENSTNVSTPQSTTLETEMTAFVLTWIQRWLVEQVESFDHTLGTMSRLSYFLTERDLYSVDIEWSWRNATRATNFCEALMELMFHHPSFLQYATPSFQVLSRVLLETPPMRVVPTLPVIFTKDVKRLQSVAQVCYEASTEDRFIFAEFVLGIASLGLGPEMLYLFGTAFQQFDLRCLLVPGHRCNCSFCELLRRTKKALKFRNEFGIEASHDLIASLVPTLIKTNIISLVVEVLADALLLHTFNIRTQELINSLCLVLLLARQIDPGINIISLMDPDKLVKILHNPLLIDSFEPHNGGFGIGYRIFLYLLCQCLMAQSPSSFAVENVDICVALIDLLNRVTSTLVDFLKSRREVPFEFKVFDVVASYMWLLACADLGSRYSSIAATSYASNDWEAHPSCLAKNEDFVNCVDLLCRAAINTDISKAPDPWKKELFSGLTCCIGIICDCYAYFRVEDSHWRRKVLEPPCREAGHLLQCIRLLLPRYQELFPVEGCSFIRIVLHACVNRAEQAVAVMNIQSS